MRTAIFSPRPAIWEADDGPSAPRFSCSRIASLPSTPRRNSASATVFSARINRLETPDVEGHRYEAEAIKVLPRDKRRLLGIFRSRANGGGTIEPIDRRELRSWQVQKGDEGGAKDGDLVRFDLSSRSRHISCRRCACWKRSAILTTAARSASSPCTPMASPTTFPPRCWPMQSSSSRLRSTAATDLTKVPLLTIDPIDARDHDDAVYAEPDTDPRNQGGHVVIVAIADVAHYIRSGTRLDKEAQVRGNSVYFPDRVVPMLPRAHLQRSLLAARTGRASVPRRAHGARQARREAQPHLHARHDEKRGQAQLSGGAGGHRRRALREGRPLLDHALKPLWDAYRAAAKAREARQPLDLDLPERKILLDKEGRVDRVVVPPRLEAHRLIEEFMILANVAAAETLEQKKTPVVYRMHDAPSKEKLAALRDFLETLDIKIPAGNALKPEAFNRVLARAKHLPVPELVNEVVLRSQAQAEYNPANIGHFGLNLARYAHFTSPIRRYADLLVHRGLVRALRLRSGRARGRRGWPDSPTSAKSISEAERRAMAAERETVDRMIAAHLADRVGVTFEARVAGVTRSGLFVKLKETGADGFIPVSTLGRDFFNYVEAAHALVGNRTGETYQLGDQVTVKLVEVIPSAGAMRFEMRTPRQAELAHQDQELTAGSTWRSRRRR